jgi:hypothetical protein
MGFTKSKQKARTSHQARQKVRHHSTLEKPTHSTKKADVDPRRKEGKYLPDQNIHIYIMLKEAPMYSTLR